LPTGGIKISTEITIHAGSGFKKQLGYIHYEGFLNQGDPYLQLTPEGGRWYDSEKILASDIVEIEIVTEQTLKNKTGSRVGGALVGGLLLGPLGAVAGAIVGGGSKSSNRVTFAAKLRDGRSFLATTDHSAFVRLKAANF